MSTIWMPQAVKQRCWNIPSGDVKIIGGFLKDCGMQSVGPSPDIQMRVHVWQRADHLKVIVSVDPHPDYGELLHVSLSFPDRLPDWKTVVAVREAFFADDIDVMMVLPRREHYVNLHEFTFHLWQTPTEWNCM